MSQSTDPIPGISTGVELLSFLRPYVRHCGDLRRPPWSLNNRCLLDYLLVYIAEGNGTFEIDGTKHQAEPNDLFWIPPNTIHSMQGNPPGMLCPYVHFDLVYRPEICHWDFSIPDGMTDLTDLAPLMHPDIPNTTIAGLKGKIKTTTNRRVGTLLRKVCAEAMRAQPFAGLCMSGLMTEIMAEIFRGLTGLCSEYGEHVPLLELAAEYLRDNSHRNISVEDAAEVARLSPSYFRRIFAAHFNCSPRSYLHNARIQKAKQLMILSGRTLSEIAQQTGFATVHSFSRAFKKSEGMSPSEYSRCGPGVTYVDGRVKPYSR